MLIKRYKNFGQHFKQQPPFQLANFYYKIAPNFQIESKFLNSAKKSKFISAILLISITNIFLIQKKNILLFSVHRRKRFVKCSKK